MLICGIVVIGVFLNELFPEKETQRPYHKGVFWNLHEFNIKHKVLESCVRLSWLLGSLLTALLAFCGIAGIIIMLVPQIFTWSLNYAIANPTAINQAFAGFAPIGVIYIGFALAIQLSIKLLLMPYPEGWEKK
jgi:hypothetical protein